MRALVIDGPGEARARLAQACRARGHDVELRAEGEALGRLVGPHAPTFAVAIGASAVRRVRAEPGGAAVFILGAAPASAADDVLEAGADDFLALDASDAMVDARLRIVERRALDEDRPLTEALRVFPDLVVRLDGDGRLLSIRLGLGYQARLLDPSRTGETLEDVFVPDDAAALRALLQEVLRTRQALSDERRYDLRGVARWFETRWFPGRSGDAIVLARDVTDRKVTEQRLRESERRTKAIFESRMLGMLEWGIDGTIIDANDALLAMIGYTRAELEAGAVSWSKMTPEEYWALEEKAGAEIMARGVCTPFEKEYVRKDGRRVPIIIGGVALDELGSHGLSFVIDISDRKRVERELRESNERFEVVARATTDAVWDWDLASGEITWNQTFHTIFGYPKDDVGAGLAWWADKLHPDDRERVAKSLEDAVARGDLMWANDYRFRAADGSYAHVSDRGYILRDASGVATRAIGAMVDVTERTEMQRRLLLADRLASLGTLAAGVAHEINNPLTHVIGNLDVAVPRLSSSTPRDEAALAALADARVGAERVREIVRDLRTFARVDVARRDVVDIHEPLDWATRIAGHAIQARARLHTSLRPVPPVLGDESRLGQVFVNLLVNAAQAIPAGDPGNNEVRVSTDVRDGWVVVNVEDTGVGIPDHIRTRIFDPFFTTKDVGVGTGLGLSICHGIVSSLGGTMEVESELGRGTTFRVVLPAAASTAEAEPEREESAPRGRRGRMLIVDDDALTRALLDRTLSAEHDVVAVASAEQALALVQGGERFDLILSDLMMPGMNGMQLYRAIGIDAPEQAERVVFLTAGVNAETQRFLDDVPNAWLEKPFDLDALLEMARRRIR